MTTQKLKRAAILSVALLAPVFWRLKPAAANVRLPHIYSDHMVLQRDKPVPIVGQADPGEKVTVELAAGKWSWTGAATAGPDGNFTVNLPAHKADGLPYRLTVAALNTLRFEDVLFGEVWMCSGQSNMALPLSMARDADKEIAAAGDPQLRLFSSPFATRAVPQADVVAGVWKVSGPESARDFSAVGYLFGRILRQRLGVPVGVVLSSVGGTVIESWINQPGTLSSPDLAALNAAYVKGAAAYPVMKPGTDAAFAAPDLADGDWKTMNLPGAWEKSGQGLDELDGAVWYRREVTLPASWEGKALDLSLGPIDDGDQTYFNNLGIGATDLSTPSAWTVPRRYAVPAEAVKGGRAVIAVRITDQLGAGGFVGKPEEMWLAPVGHPEEKIQLDGAWKYLVAESWPHSGLVSSLYNGMVAPWTALPVKGVVWYQGESNAGNGGAYARTLPGLITGWRAAWKEADLPFLVVQLPNYMPVQDDPAPSNWASLREAQATTAASMANVHLAVSIDLGEAGNIHPKDKQDVAARVAAVALHRVYGQNVPDEGPRCEKVEVAGATVTLHFTQPLTVRGDLQKTFALAGANHKLVWATAKLAGNTVTLENAAVPSPTAVQYAWADNPPNLLYNAAGFPAAPFRVDGTTVVPAK